LVDDALKKLLLAQILMQPAIVAGRPLCGRFATFLGFSRAVRFIGAAQPGGSQPNLIVVSDQQSLAV